MTELAVRSKKAGYEALQSGDALSLRKPEPLPLHTDRTADGRFVTRFALRLAKQLSEPGAEASAPAYDAFVLEHLLTALDHGQRIDFVYRHQPGDQDALKTEFQTLGSASAAEEDTAVTNAMELGDAIRRLLAARGDCGFVPADPWPERFPHAYRVDVEGILLTDQAKPSGVGKLKTPVILPAISLVEARVPFWDALLSCPFPVEVSVSLEPVRLQSPELDSLAQALAAVEGRTICCETLPGRQWLNKTQMRLLANHFERELGRWLTLSSGMRAAITLCTREAISAGALRWLAQTLLPTQRLEVVRLDAKSAACPGAVDLRLCINESHALPPLLPSRETLRRLGLPLGFTRPGGKLGTSGIVLGRTWGSEVRLSEPDRERHCYVVGATGCGKSTLLRNMILQDIENGEGVAVIDPHGDLYLDVLKSVPQHRARDVTLIDPTDFERAPGINYLEVPGAYPTLERSFVVNELLKIFERLYDMRQAGGPMFETYMRNALLLLMESRIEGATLLEVPAVFEDKAFRKAALRHCTNPAVKRFWELQAEPARGDAQLENIAPYITSKLNQFAGNALVRSIVGQSRSTIDLRKAMGQGRIVLVNLAKGMLGEYDSSLLGMLVVAKLFAAALGRARLAPKDRRPFNVYIDEFQNFTTDTLSQLLSEARKFGIRLTLANQVLHQINVGRGPDNLAAAVLGNVGTLLAMRVGGEDVETLRMALGGQLDSHTLRALPDFHVAARLLQGGHPLPPFVFETLPAQARRDIKAEKFIAQSYRESYTRPVAEVEREISSRVPDWSDYD